MPASRVALAPAVLSLEFPARGSGALGTQVEERAELGQRDPPCGRLPLRGRERWIVLRGAVQGQSLAGERRAAGVWGGAAAARRG